MSFIERLQLTPEEKQIYQLLLGAGQLTAFEIAQFSKLHFSKVQLALDGLKTKGAVGISEGYITKYFVRIPLDYLAQTSDQLSGNIKTNIDEASNYIQGKKSEFEQIRSNLTTKLSEDISTKKGELEQHISQSVGDIETLTQQQKNSIGQKLNVLKNKMDEVRDTQQETTLASIKDFHINNIDSLNQAKTTTNTIVENIGRKNVETIDTSNAQIQHITNQTIEKFQSLTGSVRPQLDEINEAFSTNLNELIQLLQQNIDTTKMDVRGFNRTQVDKYVGFSEETARKTGETIDKISESVSGSLSELNSSLELLLNRKVEDLTLQVTEAINALNEKIEIIKANLMDEIAQQKNTAINNTLSQIKETMAMKYTNLQNSEQNQRNEAISERDIFMQKLEAHYNESINIYEQKIAEVKEDMTSKFAGFKNSLASQFEEVTTNLINNTNTQISSFKDLSTHLNSAMLEELNVGSSRMKEKWNDLISKTENLIQESETNISQQYQELANLIETTSNSVLEELGSFVQQTMDSALKATNALISTSKTALDQGREIITGSLNDEITASANFIESTERKFSDTANILISSTMKLKNDFRTLEATSREVEIPPVQTTSIIGLEAVLDHLARIVRDAKRSVTILAPRKEYIPIDAIKELPSTAKITIVTELDEQMDSDWINNVASAQANVEVRKFRGMGTGVELPKFIGVERENEEVLIAAEDEATKQVVGILSKSTYFAGLVSYIVIADYARGRSAQIK